MYYLACSNQQHVDPGKVLVSHELDVLSAEEDWSGLGRNDPRKVAEVGHIMQPCNYLLEPQIWQVQIPTRLLLPDL